ncbi:hypothetical protein KBY58_00080 [Cyanobium sp. HWJ4-Hawea]|uniref:hypothetical protein n=2 Tax=unclassified Cyanobium TaxID=2627006 RepID=UPI0020CBD096|nr:hypothetical protein [Cyanobium sp. WAJ14-Wanaka]MCP9774149.1 hypothetical protein [Cyanobium sp. WAJ14-Wanaka]MCP9807832.1 hypothetical protein [Cyanobium sp. HWJ4-Hawea]
MDDMLQTAFESALETAIQSADETAGLATVSGANAFVFVLIAGLGAVMALVYLPLRLFLTITARSRRLKLLQRIRRLRDDLAQPAVKGESAPS